jgi:GDPmannose 4,6-dehydratase
MTLMVNNLNKFLTFQLSTDEVLIEVDPQYFRPAEVEMLLGDRSKAEERLGWEPKYTINELVEDMIKGDSKKLNKRNNNFNE